MSSCEVVAATAKQQRSRPFTAEVTEEGSGNRIAQIYADERIRKLPKARLPKIAEIGNLQHKDVALYKEQAVSKEEILEAIKKMAEELGRAPSLPELRDKTGISPRQVRRNFLSYTGALKACGLERGGAGYTTPMDALFKDWAELTRKLGRVPKINEYDMYAKYSAKPLLTRFGTGAMSRRGCCLPQEQQGWEGGWEDVLEVARVHLRAAGKAVRRSRTATGRLTSPKS